MRYPTITGAMMLSKSNAGIRAQLLDAIQKSGLNRFQLAKHAGLPYAVVHGLVSGGRDVTLASAERLCEVLGLELRSMRRTGSRKRR